MAKIRDSSTTNVSSILIGALVSGLAVGFPLGYLARQMYAAAPNSSPNSNVATLEINR